MIYLHLRVSTDGQEKHGQGLEAQEAAGRQLFQSKEVKVIKEVGSGRKENLEDRPILTKTLESLKEGDTIWFYDEDRMSRDNGVKKHILKILRKKKAFLKIRNEDFDIYDIQDCLRLGLKGEMDEYMGAWLVQRMKAGRDIAVIQKGRWYGGVTPFGYQKVEGSPTDLNYHRLLPQPEEANHYRQIVKWCLNGLGSNKIACRLNELGVKTNFSIKGRKGQVFRWQQQVVLRILKNPIYKGEFRYKGKVIKVVPLISEKEWGRIREQLKQHAIYSPRNRKHFYLLSGLLNCSICGRRFFGRINKCSGDRNYSCISKKPSPEPRFCGMKSINLDKANSIVWSEIRGYILNSDKLRQAIKAQKDTTFVDRVGLDAELSSLRKQISIKDSELKDLIRGRSRYSNISESDIDDIAGEIKSEKNNLLIREHELVKAISKLDIIDDKAKEIERFLSGLDLRVDKLSEDEKFEVIHAIVDKIVVSYREGQHSLEILLALDEASSRSNRPHLAISTSPFGS